MVRNLPGFLQLKTLLYPALILLVSYFCIFKNYQNPGSFFWDENYHVAAAQKYLNGVFFMEPHPPLGKLLIAAGEWIFSANKVNDQFISTDHAPNTPAGFSFIGYRFFPVLLATFCPLLLFLIMRSFSTPLLAAFIALLFATDNALIVHLRGAMLEGIQLFFFLLFLYALACSFKLIFDQKSQSGQLSWLAILTGASLAAVLTTKLNGIILLVPLAALFYLLLREKLVILYLSNFLVSFVAVFILVWSIHIHLGKRIVPQLPEAGFYKASVPYRISLSDPSRDSLGFFAKLYDNFAFLPHYTKGVPELNYCKKEENGSPWYWWIVGGKTISYRWDKQGDVTRHIYLIANPFGWGLSICGLILSLCFISSRLFFSLPASNRTFYTSLCLLISWVLYIGLFGNLGRVMYLYHYFIPLVLGWIMLGVVCSQITHFGSWKLNSFRKKIIFSVVCLAQVCSFVFFSPLTYGKGLTDSEFALRGWLSVWDLRCAGCESKNPLARPIGDAKRNLMPEVSISGIKATESFQDWGEPTLNKTVTKEPIIANEIAYQSGLGVHAESKLIFEIKQAFSRFSASVAIPDYIKQKSGGSVIFSVVADGKKIWESKKISAGMEPEKVSIGISEVSRLSLEVSNAGDSNTDDHALWLNPLFE